VSFPISAPPRRNSPRYGPTIGAFALMLIATTVAQYAVWPHVQEEQDDEDARAPPVHAAHEPAQREVVRDVLDRRVGLFRRRLVVHGEDHAGDRLHEEGGERRRAEGVEPVRLGGDLAEEEVLDPADEPGALLEPVDRDHHGLLELLLPLRPRPSHQLPS
jgi:hypothetical protein